MLSSAIGSKDLTTLTTLLSNVEVAKSIGLLNIKSFNLPLSDSLV